MTYICRTATVIIVCVVGYCTVKASLVKTPMRRKRKKPASVMLDRSEYSNYVHFTIRLCTKNLEHCTPYVHTYLGTYNVRVKLGLLKLRTSA